MTRGNEAAISDPLLTVKSFVLLAHSSKLWIYSIGRQPFMSVQLARRLFTVDEYHRMGEVEIFSVSEHLELIEGEILIKVPITSRHA